VLYTFWPPDVRLVDGHAVRFVFFVFAAIFLLTCMVCLQGRLLLGFLYSAQATAKIIHVGSLVDRELFVCYRVWVSEVARRDWRGGTCFLVLGLGAFSKFLCSLLRHIRVVIDRVVEGNGPGAGVC